MNRAVTFPILLACMAVVGCSGGDSSSGGGSGSGGTDAGAGSGGTAGSTGGSAGSTGGSAGSTGGSAGSTGGSAGSTGGASGSGGGGGCTPKSWYKDADGDAFGDPNSSIQACTPPAGYVSDNTDCDDAVKTTYPGATEACNAVDDDCSQGPDDTFACVQGAAVACTTSCGTQGNGTCTASCADPTGNACTPPTETCNGKDDDCDGLGDESFIKAAARQQLAYQASPNLVFEKLVPHADGTYTLVYVRDDSYNVIAQKVTANGTATGGAVTVVSGASYGGLIRSVDAIDISGRLFVAWLSSTGQPYITSRNLTSYSQNNAPKAYGSNGANMVRLTNPSGFIHLNFVRRPSTVTYLQRVEMAVPTSGAAFPTTSTLKTHISGGLPSAAFGAAAGSNTVIGFLSSSNRVEVLSDNGGSTNTDFKVLSTITGHIRYPSVAATPSGGIGVAWAEYPTSGSPRIRFAYLANIFATPVYKTIDAAGAPYFLAGSNERFERKTDLSYSDGPKYFLLGFSNVPNGQSFSAGYPKGYVMWPVGSITSQPITLATSAASLNGPNYEVSLAGRASGGMIAYDHAYGSTQSGQRIGCY